MGGQTKRVNQCLEMFLLYVVHDTPSHWAKWLDSAKLWYNKRCHTSLKCSPCKPLYGVDPNVGMLPSAVLDEVNDGSLTF